ncbi:nuclear pore complex protein Nup98-Nup96 isoform X1 [Petromyzon marinus]|uniref:nuclear pore complex protein Nup98-Nup96 isoform X1 n=1 Tax=Petromyzon marinus TaxID=7757 RepID=UPI003F6F1167
MFGQNKPFGSTFGSTFGGNASTFGQTSNAGGFGSFGAAGFGAAPAGGGMFGGTNQTKPAGLFGAGAFGQAPANATSTSGFGAATSAAGNPFSSSLFSTPQTNNAANTGGFVQNKPAGFGGFGANAGSGGLFGTTTATVTQFGANTATGGAFGGFSAQATKGTTIKFIPVEGTDTMMKNGASTTIRTKHQCITAMKEYETKSLEELRLEDYTDNRKGLQPGALGAAATGSLFGAAATPVNQTGGLFGTAATAPAAATGFAFGQPKPNAFGTGAAFSGSASTGGGLFGNTQAQPGAAAAGAGGATGGVATGVFSKPFGVATATTQASGFSFSGAATATPFGQANATTGGLFGAVGASRPGGLFGAGTATTATAGAGFGTGGAFGVAAPTSTGLFGATQQSSGFGATGATLFGNKPAGFAAPATSTASGFGTGVGGGLFGAKPGGLSLGATNNATGFGFGSANTGGLFGNKITTGGLGAGLGSTFGSGLGTGQPSLFGNSQPTMGTGLGVSSLSTAPFGGVGSSTGFGTTQGTLGATQAGTAQAVIHQNQITALAYNPFGDSPLFRNIVTDPQKKEERLKPTNPEAQKAFSTPTHYRLTPRPAARLRPKALGSSGSAKAQLFDGLDDEDAALCNATFMPRKSVKKLAIKSTQSPVFSPLSHSKDHDDLAPPSDYPVNGLSNGTSLALHANADDTDVSRELPSDMSLGTPGGVEVGTSTRGPPPKMHKSLLNGSLDGSLLALNVRQRGRSASGGSRGAEGGAMGGGMDRERGSEESSSSVVENLTQDDEDYEPDEEQQRMMQPHPAGIVLTRFGYYTIPPMDELARLTDENGDCIVNNFTIGRQGYGSICFSGEINLKLLNLDAIVHIRRKEVIVYPDDNNKPPCDEGLNRRAEVTLDGVWPLDKTTGRHITSPERLMRMAYEERLERASTRQGALFREYRPETGSWVFDVKHFSKYGIQDDEEDEDEVVDPLTGKVLPALPPGHVVEGKKLKTGLAPPAMQQSQKLVSQGKLGPTELGGKELGGLGGEQDSEMADISLEPVPRGFYAEDDDDTCELQGHVGGYVKELENGAEPVAASHHLASYLGMSTHRLQVMKASFLAEEEEAEVEVSPQRFGAVSHFPSFSVMQNAPCAAKLADMRALRSRLSGALLQSKFGLGSTIGMDATVVSPHKDLGQDHLATKPRMSTIREPSHHMSLSRPYSLLSPPVGLPVDGKAGGPGRAAAAPQRVCGLIPAQNSVAHGRHYLADAALYAGRSFRVGWGPCGSLCHVGDLIGCTNSEEQSTDRHEEVGLKAFTPTLVKRIAPSPFKVHVECVSVCSWAGSEGRCRIQEKLEIALEESERVNEHAQSDAMELGAAAGPDDRELCCPLFRPRPGVSSVHRYAHWVEDVLAQEAAASTSEAETLKQWYLVWTLCEALWGQLHGRDRVGDDNDDVDVRDEEEAAMEGVGEGGGRAYAQQAERREALSRWLERAALEKVEGEVALGGNGKLSTYAVFSCLSGRQIARACRLAQDAGDHRLALLISQAVGSKPTRQLLALNLSEWGKLQVDHYINSDRIAVYTLLSGKPVWEMSAGEPVNVCESLDWKRSLAVHLWYMLSPVMSVADALKAYENAFKGSDECERYACRPLPPYMEDNKLCPVEEEEMDEEERKQRRPVRDACYHLLKLYSDKHYDLDQLCDASSVTADPLDYRLSWHLWLAVQALGYQHLPARSAGALHAAYAAQLESAGLWEWAVFVLMNIPDASSRTKAVREMLGRHCSEVEMTEEAFEFVTGRLGVPASWLHEAQAHRARQLGDHRDEAHHLLHAGLYNACHRVVIRNLAADAIINENYGYLKTFLEEMAAPEISIHIPDWEVAGRVFLDYIRVTETLLRLHNESETPGAELEALYTEVALLCPRIEDVPCFSARDRLSQAEMAKQTANILRAVMSLQQGGGEEGKDDVRPGGRLAGLSLHPYAQHIGQLPLPGDYALQELRTLVSAYRLALTT